MCTTCFRFSRKNYKLQKFLFSRKFSILIADSDPGANWMCIEIRNTVGCYLKIKKLVFAEGFENTKIFAKTWSKTKIFAKTKIYHEIFREHGNSSQKLFQEQKFPRNLWLKQKFLRKRNISKKLSLKVSPKQKFLRKLLQTSKFSLIFAFRENEKRGVFVSTFLVMLYSCCIPFKKYGKFKKICLTK
jgi:hypothetical protein